MAALRGGGGRLDKEFIVPDWVGKDREWRAAVHILGSPILCGKAWAYVDFGERLVRFLEMPIGVWSHGEQLLVQAAWDLFNRMVGVTWGSWSGHWTIGIWRCSWRLWHCFAGDSSIGQTLVRLPGTARVRERW